MKNFSRRLLAALLTALLLCAIPAAMAETNPIAAAADRTINLYGNATVNMNVGESAQIALNGVYASSWKSSSTKILVVDGTGRVTAIKEGKAKVTVKLTNKKKYVLTVVVSDPYKPDAVALKEGSAISIYAGKSATLHPVLHPTTASTVYTWKSSKTKVATVNANGVVTGITKGTAKITVTTANKLKTTITVTVLGNKIDDIYPYSSVQYALSQLSNENAWDIGLKSLEIVSPTQVVAEYYVVNGMRYKGTRLTSMNFDIKIDGKNFVNGYFSKISGTFKPKTITVIKVTFKNSQVLNSNWVFANYDPNALRNAIVDSSSGYMTYRY